MNSNSWASIGVLRAREDAEHIEVQAVTSGRWHPLASELFDNCVILVPWRIKHPPPSTQHKINFADDDDPAELISNPRPIFEGTIKEALWHLWRLRRDELMSGVDRGRVKVFPE